MVCLPLRCVSLSLVLFAAFSIAHPGHGGLKQEIAERSEYLKRNPTNLDHCAAKLQARGIPNRALARRMVAVEDLQDKAKLRKRALAARETAFVSATLSAAFPSGSSLAGGDDDTSSAGGRTQQNISDFGSSVANASHLSMLSVYPNMTNIDTMIFGNNSCILNPEGEVGPYYVQGEYIRSVISEDQAGVPLYMDQQYIDVTTCEPIEGLFADIWHCNATGVYAGVVATGNGNINDTTNINSTFLRGIQQSNEDGVVNWETIFPGYYQGRTTHIHMVTHMNATQLSNGTITGGNITHVGQLMFDQTLTNEINENVSPYTSNTQTITENDEDSVFIAETLTDSDPVVNYVMLGDDFEDGLFAWITIGVDPAALYDASAAAIMSEDGGYETRNSQVM